MNSEKMLESIKKHIKAIYVNVALHLRLRVCSLKVFIPWSYYLTLQH